MEGRGLKEGERLLERASLLMEGRGYRLKGKEEREGRIDLTAKEGGTRRKVLIRIVTKSELSSGAIGTGLLRSLEKAIKQGETERGIMIAKQFTPAARAEAKREGIELFSEKELLPFDLFRHDLIPRHVVLTEEEVERLLKRYRIKPWQLPRIPVWDPAVRFIGAKAGDVLKITRKSPTRGSAVVYRYVVETT